MATKTRVTVDQQVQFDQYISAACVMSAANTFTQITIPTGVSPDSEFILSVKEIQFAVEGSVPITAYQNWIGLTLTRNSKAALPNLTDADIIAVYRFTSLGAGTFAAASTGIIESPVNMAYSGKQIIAGPNVYLQMNTSGLTNALNGSIRIYYDTINMKKSDILEILYG